MVVSGKFYRLGCCKTDRLHGRVRILNEANPLGVKLLKQLVTIDYLGLEKRLWKLVRRYETKQRWFVLPEEMQDLAWFKEGSAADEQSKLVSIRLPINVIGILKQHCLESKMTQTEAISGMIQNLNS